MQLVRDVVTDLWQFIASELRGIFSRDSTAVSEGEVESSAARLTLVSDTDTTPTPTIPIPAPLATPADSTPEETAVEYNSAYYVAYPETPCHLRPALVQDTIIGLLAYGEKVQVISRREDWVHIKTDELEGWVERFAITPHPDDVFPTFTTGERYDAEHPETIKLRTYIDDEFNSRLLRLPALNSEYVWYRLLRVGRAFAWPIVRPRSPGRWAEILRTESSVVRSSVPLTGSVMEYTDSTAVGHLYYVESVAPDESVSVTGMAADASGEYTKHTFTPEEWKATQCTFLCKV